MIKPDMIPDDVVVALRSALDRSEYLDTAIAAALNAWPGVEIEMVGESDDFLMLPLPQEETKNDAPLPY